MYSKAEIFNIALNALLLTRQIVDADQDMSTEAKALRKMWLPAFKQTVADLDLDRLHEIRPLELVATDPNHLWKYCYKYPNNCAGIRRIVSNVREDNRMTKIPLSTGTRLGISVIYTNQDQAELEYIPSDVPLTSFSASAGLALAHQLAFLSSALIVGKAAQKIRQEVFQTYLYFKAEAQEQDRVENNNFEADAVVSEFVAARIS